MAKIMRKKNRELEASDSTELFGTEKEIKETIYETSETDDENIVKDKNRYVDSDDDLWEDEEDVTSESIPNGAKKNDIQSSYDDDDIVDEDDFSDYLLRPIRICKGLENGVYKAEVKRITELKNSRLQIVFTVFVGNFQYTLNTYHDGLIMAGSPLYKLLNALKKSKPRCLKDIIKKKVYISVRINESDGKRYENIVDYASIEHLKGELYLDEYGKFIY